MRVCNKYCSFTIHLPASNLPEMQVNQGFSVSRIYSALGSKVINTATDFQYSCCFTCLPDSDVCHGCDGCVSAALTTGIKQEVFEEGETLFCAIDGWFGLVRVKSIELDDTGVLRFVVTDNNGKDIATTREHLRSPSNPDIGWIPSSVPEYGSASRCLTDKEVKTLCSPLHLSPLRKNS